MPAAKGRYVRDVKDNLRIAGLAIAVTLAIAVGVPAVQAAVSVSSDPLREIRLQLPGVTGEERRAGPSVKPTPPGDLSLTLLLLGYGGPGVSGGNLTDSIMIARLERRDGQTRASVVSVPRDLWVEIPADRYAGARWAKVNEAFAPAASRGDRDEGMRTAARTIASALGVRIERTVAVDYRAFRGAVDAVGGVTIQVERAFDAMYPAHDDKSVSTEWIWASFPAGAQQMDGERALRYARARYVDGPEGSDFARAARQQQVLMALRQKLVLDPSLAQRGLRLLDALRDNVRTDLSLAEMITLSEVARQHDDARTTRGGLSTANVLVSSTDDERGYILAPRTSWADVRAYVADILDGRAGPAETPASGGAAPPTAAPVSPPTANAAPPTARPSAPAQTPSATPRPSVSASPLPSASTKPPPAPTSASGTAPAPGSAPPSPQLTGAPSASPRPSASARP